MGDRGSAITVISFVCLAVIIHYFRKNGTTTDDVLAIAGSITLAVGIGILIISQYYRKHNRP